MTSATNHILVVDDSTDHRELLRELLEHEHYKVSEASDGVEAIRTLDAGGVHLALIDLHMPRIDGIQLLRQMMMEYPNIPSIVISGMDNIEKAVEATRLGAFDYIQKPVDPERAIHLIRSALNAHATEEEQTVSILSSRKQYKMIGTTAEMDRVFKLVDKSAKVHSKVLIHGESGTGKELVAKAIHDRSGRAAGPFVPVNCAAIPEELVESTLFGHEKGSFTGAHARQIGRFEEASGGTLLLDEIGEMSLGTQSKLLRVIETGTIRRVGSDRPIQVDIRLIAATNKDLKHEVENGNFRKDLFYRLSVIEIVLPALRHRWEDVPALVEHYITLFSRENQLPNRVIAPGGMVLLTEYDWPGNVRELRNVVERLVVLAEDRVISVSDVEAALASGDSGITEDSTADTLREARERFEARYIRRALEQNGGRIQETAVALGIDRTHLWKKMKTLGIEA